MLNPKILSAAVALVLVASSAAAATPEQVSSHVRASVHGGVDHVTRDAQGRVLYMVLLQDPPTAQYHGGGVRAVAGLAKIPSISGKGGKIDVHSSQAEAYVSHLANVQGAMVSQLQSQGIPVQPVEKYRYALNGFTVWLSSTDAKRVAATAGVRSVTPMRENRLLTDRGPSLIGAPQLWFGNAQATGDTLFVDGFEETSPGNRGEGTVIGMLDTGINFDSHSFDDPDASGYHYINPNSGGSYLGWCNNGDPCNNKVFGSWDFAVLQPHDGYLEPPGAEDENGHGSHTASTAAGNTRQVNYMGRDLTISGVAPHANLIAYDVCYTNPSTGDGSCPYAATTDAVERAIEDGVVDVINYSIGGGDDPWNDPTEMAFLSAVDSGIFVAAAAGNDGPAAGTVEHLGPWVTTVAASTHDRSDFYWTLQPQGGQLVQMALGTAGTQPSAPLPAGTQLIVSPQFDIADTTGTDGCVAYPAGTFQDGIALISRGTCNFSIKAANAVAAGAVMVAIANNRDGNDIVAPTGDPPVAVPVFGVSQNDGNYLVGTTTDGKVVADFSYPATIFPQTPDVMADFSSRGPASLNLLKPDVSAPGVAILAAVNGDADALGVYYGTSMATPHVAGSAALLHKAHPEWTPMEIKSALMLTAKSADEMLEQDESTPATPLDAGAGRVQVDQAAKAGLVMDENALNMYLADPAQSGDPSQLNLASLYNDQCADTCDFNRSMTGVLPGSQQWAVSATMPAPLTVSAPASITATGGSSVPLNLQVDTSAATAPGYYFGELTLTADGNDDTPVLHMPIAVQVPPATIEVAPASVSESTTAGSSVSIPVDLTIGNSGGVQLGWHWAEGNDLTYVPVDQPSADYLGYPSSTYGSNPDYDIWLADDFDVGAGTTLTFLSADGFQLSDIQNLAGDAATITFLVYADAGGMPDGTPDGSGNQPVFSCTLPVGSLALSYSGYDSVKLDVANSGCATTPLAAGKYWLSVSGDYAGTGQEDNAQTWYWFDSTTGGGDPVQATYTGAGTWGGIPDVFGDPMIAGNAMRVSATTNCDGAKWLIPATTAGSVGSQEQRTLTVTIDPTGLAAGDYIANACLSSNDPVRSMVVVPVTLHVE